MFAAQRGFADLVDLADTMAWSSRPDEALAAGAVAVRCATGADLAVFYLLDDRGQWLRLVGEPDERRLLAGYEELPVSGYGRMPQLIRTLRPIMICDLAHPEPEDFLPDDLRVDIVPPLRTGAVVPLVSGLRLVGVICLSFESAQSQLGDQVDFLALVGRIVGSCVFEAQAAASLRELAAQAGSVAAAASAIRAELLDQMAAGPAAADVTAAGPHLPERRRTTAGWPALTAARPGPAAVRLTPREGEIMALVVDGRSNAQIGLTLGVSPETVKKSLGRIMDKLQVNNRVQAAARVLREGLVS
ncbi:MAG: LuxR C-terminal-related transcriptional regulator [Bifidobacteriaceae bacterium]|nr:LuxR C-terminal-related transcriptional regulator [Bifidobacteriaceae bacterium]